MTSKKALAEMLLNSWLLLFHEYTKTETNKQKALANFLIDMNITAEFDEILKLTDTTKQQFLDFWKK